MVEEMSRTTIAVAICTYNRNDALANLLASLKQAAAQVGKRAAIGVVVVDDSSDGKARGIVDKFEGCFELGIHYRFSGRQNISIARNLAIETACRMADWTAMTDDDCEAPPEWLEALLDTQRKTDADAVSGTMVRRVPSGSPAWLISEPFLELGLERPAEATELLAGSTFNSMISSRWLKTHPQIRFQPALGVLGGEDMVFYRSAHSAGMRIFYSEQGYVYENAPASRATLRYQLRAFFWHGNSSYVTCIYNGIPPVRMFFHGVNSLRRALIRPLARIARGQNPQLRYCLASVLHAFGKMSGPFGVRVDHK